VRQTWAITVADSGGAASAGPDWLGPDGAREGPGGRYCNASAPGFVRILTVRRALSLSSVLQNNREMAQETTGGTRFALRLASAMPATTQASATPCAGVGRSPRKAMP
jgi:hypothetical protein